METGGRQGIQSSDLIKSAIARPYCGYYRRIYEKAAALTDSLARNHGFVDGNKRTTLIMVYTLLEKSGYRLHAASRQGINREAENIILDVVTGKTSFAELVEWYRKRIRRR